MADQIIFYTGVAALNGLAFVLGVGATDLFQSATQEPEPPAPYALVVDRLVYADDIFYQWVLPQGTEVIAADWSAKIERDGFIVCSSSGGRSSYRKRTDPAKMTPQIWTGDDSCEVQDGDIAYASWTYKDRFGNTVTVSAKHVIDIDRKLEPIS